jgi:putative redox protein
MGRKSASLTLLGDGKKFLAQTGSGHSVVMDDADGDGGPRPAELVPMALAGCAAMDVISILRKKRQEVSEYRVEVVGHQRDEASPHVFTRFDVTHIVEGPDIDEEAVRRSIELSATRYCTVGVTLASGIAELHHGYVVRTRGVELVGEVGVTGPYRHPDAPFMTRSGVPAALR